ncbi:hypothetical protein AK830_g7221 [Neonectria ditissima]|uniref:GATA-type domain-containing protein n=1 Tax=Neonectria ditissima TaxID=78410 RepID=A0A0P7AXN2_9HYPO|nr:hypothetical protein AK830_g7221 [Neonectria ditissima]
MDSDSSSNMTSSTISMHFDITSKTLPSFRAVVEEICPQILKPPVLLSSARFTPTNQDILETQPIPGTSLSLEDPLYHGIFRDALQSRADPQTPIGGSQQILLTNGVSLDSPASSQGQQVVDASRNAQLTPIADYPQSLRDIRKTQIETKKATASGRVARRHRPGLLRSRGEENNLSLRPPTGILDRKSGYRGKGLMEASGGCQICGTTKTSQWRTGPGYGRLCHACGLSYKKELKNVQGLPF